MRYIPLLLLCAPAAAQSGTHQIALNYNWNGIVHQGEDGQPDNPDGYRSIGDRGLNFAGGAPSDAMVDKYNLVTDAGVLDIVNLGCRPCTGWNGWDAAANGDCRGTEPTWLNGNSDHSGPQTTWFTNGIVLSGESQISCIFHVTDGGGDFSITAHTNVGDVPLGSMGAGYWFGGPYAGTDGFDCAGLAGAGLHINEGTLSDGGLLAGLTVDGLSFQRLNGSAQYAIFACNVSTGIGPETSDPITLNYNWNGIVHYSEPGNADADMGYRSIGDRGLDFTNGAPSDDLTDKYTFVQQPNALDIVHMGPRGFDTDPNNCHGDRPDWLDEGWDHSGFGTASYEACTTTIHRPTFVQENSRIDLIFNISDGGGSFNVTCNFANGSNWVGVVSAGDWWNGPYPGTGNFDCVNLPDWGLHINEGSVEIPAFFAGEQLVSITFEEPTNSAAGHAIFAANAINMDVTPLAVDAVALGYNWNGIVHAGEAGSADADMGYRSISDRGLSLEIGAPSDKKCAKYTFETAADAMDIVHLGSRGFDEDSGNCLGDQPDWLPSGWDHYFQQITDLANPMVVGPESRLELIYHISNGGGKFWVAAVFSDGSVTSAELGGNDWWNGPYPGTGYGDCGLISESLHINEATISLGGDAGKTLVGFSIGDQSNSSAGYAIFAMNMVGMDAAVVCPDNAFCFGDGSGADCPCLNFGGPCHGCANGADADGGYLETQGTPSLSNDTVVLHAKDLLPNRFCLFFSGSNAINGGMGVSFGEGLRCVGNGAVRIEVSLSDPNGEVSSTEEISTHGQAYGHTIDVGETVNYQVWYREDLTGLCGNFHNMTNAVSLTWDA